MFYVYFLKSLKNSDLYVGSTENVEKRLNLHNSGKVKSTKFYKPWELLGYEEYKSRAEAVRQEKFFKSHHQRDILKKKYMAE
jgi:putative endonuclease